jgi:hypothetical protein
MVFTAAPIAPVMGQMTTTPPWSPGRIWGRFGVDLAAAGCATLLVSPVIAAVDRAIVENTANVSTIRGSLQSSLRMACRSPAAFVCHRAFVWTAGLYGATYATANVIDTACEWAATDARLFKFLGTTPVNMALVLRKDMVFARMFAAPVAAVAQIPQPVPVPPPSLPFPRPSLALFAVRDAHTVLASFLLPPVIGAWLHEHGAVATRARGELIAQLAAPCVIQLVSTPYHILALDLFNRPSGSKGGKKTVLGADRWAVIRQKYAVTVAARMGRILPAFGVGGVTNRHVRQTLAHTLKLDV